MTELLTAVLILLQQVAQPGVPFEVRQQAIDLSNVVIEQYLEEQREVIVPVKEVKEVKPEITATSTKATSTPAIKVECVPVPYNYGIAPPSACS